MRPRRIITILAAILLLGAGALAGWFALSIPNDIQAESLLKKARTDLQKQQRERAAESLRAIVREYPRTDAAATATETLFRMADQDRKKAQQQIDLLQKQQKVDRARVDDLEKKLAAAAAKPPPAAVAKPAPAPAKKKVTKKAPPKKKSSRRR